MGLKIGAIIQARTGSSRFPSKVFYKLTNNLSILETLIERIKLSKKLNEIIIATTNSKRDDQIEEFAVKNNIHVFRGSENDVLERYYLAAKKSNLDIIVRLTADDPLKDPKVIDDMVNIFLADKDLDYVSNNIIPSFPEGLDVEVFNINALENSYLHAKLKSEREHVTPYIKKNNDLFNIKNYKSKIDMSKFRITVDYKEDLMLINMILSHFKHRLDFNYADLSEYLLRSGFTSNIIRDEGYLKSIQEDEK